MGELGYLCYARRASRSSQHVLSLDVVRRLPAAERSAAGVICHRDPTKVREWLWDRLAEAAEHATAEDVCRIRAAFDGLDRALARYSLDIEWHHTTGPITHYVAVTLIWHQPHGGQR